MMRGLALLLVGLGLEGCSALEAQRPLSRALECECCAPPGLTPAHLGRAAANHSPKPFELQERSIHGD